MKYTLDIHRERIADIIKNHLGSDIEELGRFCPAADDYRSDEPPTEWDNNQCSVCSNYVCSGGGKVYCPCLILGHEEALKRTKRKLKKDGYL